ncbi:Ribosomal large subunit pseudouridine synthase D [Botrimarina colliarenosi]|uniref:Ribosomal large subunit pseudouridine synthase D n=1 Tax=Botrimarina colliarenosi TaxID=2528001 RepID=A0A5C6AAM1_9BACT|nr:RNA pseudouridine synthase [Botrimarina colliarenosi]TWT96195.1 Ribosomal large subunit pseudouridine synthase D [Botrimarina colliarenosi]
MLSILYDDGPVLVVNKPPGLLTQAPNGIDSLELWVRDFYRQRERLEGNFYLGIIHRLDRPVTGSIVWGRNLRATQRLAKQFQERTVGKTYWAVVEGAVVEDEGTWRDHLHKRHGMAQAIVVPEDDPRGKHAILHYRVRGRAEGKTWLEITLETGRTHQIRVQAASRGHAVLGDSQYGATTPFGIQHEDERARQIALHARSLSFRHPMRDESVEVTAPLGEAWLAPKLQDLNINA